MLFGFRKDLLPGGCVMRKLAILPVLALLFACGDGLIVQPEESLSIAAGMGPAATVVAANGAVKFVPLKGNGIWWWSPEPTMEVDPCPEGSFPDFGFGEMNVTHLGRSEYAFRNCWTAEFEFVHQAGVITAANGDKLFWHSSEATQTIINWDDLTYEMGPMTFDGGTGRFEGAQGTFVSYGGTAADLLSGTEMWKGEISSVGSSKGN
jgi:hypothetical protein